MLGWVLCNGLNELDSHKNNDQFSIFFEYKKKCLDIISIISKNNLGNDIYWEHNTV